MCISDERLAHLLDSPEHISPRYELPGILTELQFLRAAAKVRAIREGGEVERPEVDTEKAALIRLAAGDRIAYSRDGETAWFQGGDRAFVADDVMMDLHLLGHIETVNEGLDEDWHEWGQITEKGIQALNATQGGK